MLKVEITRVPEPGTETGQGDQFLCDLEIKDSAPAVQEKVTGIFEQLAAEHGGQRGEGNRAQTIVRVE